MKRILLINANPKSDSLCKALAQRYAETAKKKYELIEVHIGELVFNPDLSEGYQISSDLEDDLKTIQQQIIWATHIVFIVPVWWGGMPAKFKGLIDRIFLSGFAFQYEENKSIPRKLLTGRTAQIIVTLDTPVFWYKWIQGNPLYKQLKRTILDFVGIKNQSIHYFGPVIGSNDQQKERWLNKVESLVC
ncbi:MAG: NAD(P)H dehydrogenase (quinone) [Oceanicoccus sp.]|jgi:NAD(P)H dehydrogenase (quinone)